MNEHVTSAALLSVTQSVGVFGAMLPSFGEVRKTMGDPEVVNDVRMGELAASGIVISIGLIASIMVDNPVPAMIAVGCSGAMILMYESVLNSTPKEVRA